MVTIACSLISGVDVVKVMSLLIKVHLGSVLESEVRQKWRYGALKACIC